jgi:hypothetical protein
MIGIKITDKKIIDEHYNEFKNFLTNTKGIKYKYDVLDEWILELTAKKYNLEQVIKAEPNQLKIIIEKVNKVGKNFLKKPRKKNKNSHYEKGQYFLHLYKKFSTREDDHFTKYNALSLVNELKINVCPYCNRNFINNTKLVDKNNGPFIKRTAQLDHFYPESEYPYLAISFYNLIPVCGTCNLIKLEGRIGVNPYEINNSDEHIIFDYDFDGSIHEIKVDTVYMSGPFRDNWEKLGLEELYKIHNNYVKDLLLRMKIYNSIYRKDLSQYFKRWGKEPNDNNDDYISKEDFERIIFGNYYLEKDLSMFPLSKLTKDIVRRYK